MRFVVCGVGGWDLRCFHLVGRDACVRTSELRFWLFSFAVWISWNGTVFSVMSLHWYLQMFTVVSLWFSFQMSLAIRFDSFNWLLVQLIHWCVFDVVDISSFQHLWEPFNWRFLLSMGSEDLSYPPSQTLGGISTWDGVWRVSLTLYWMVFILVVSAWELHIYFYF